MKTFGTITHKKTQWELQMEPHVSIRFKDIFRKANKSTVGTISISDSPAIRRDLDWFMSRYPLTISEQDRKAIEEGVTQYNKMQDEISALFIPGARFANYELAKQPRDYQKIAIELLLKNGALLCADDLGLGKTIVGIGAIVAAKQYPAMVVCQTHLPKQWQDKFEEFAPQIRCHIIKSRRPYTLPGADVFIMPYSRIIGWGDIIAKGTFKTVVYDECQELRRCESAKYTVSEKLTEKANRVLGLSATPIYNFGAEIFSVMNIIKPEALGTWDEFLREWCTRNYMQSEKSRVRDPKALGTFLREQGLMIRRTRKDVARELPPVNKIVHSVEYDEEVVGSTEKELEAIAARVINGSFTEKGLAARELDARARMMTGIAKAHHVAEYVKLILENDEKVLLVGWHREVYATWLQKLSQYSPVMYTGTETPTQKEAAKNAFLRDSNLMIMSLRSGIGLDGLQDVCNLIVFGELDWSPGVHEQVIGRLQRDGQNSRVTALYLVTDSGTDPLMIDILGLKSSQSQGIVNPQEELEFIQSDENRIKRLAETILRRNK